MITQAHVATPEEIMALIDGELPPERAQAVSGHLAECAECREVAEILRNGSAVVSNWTVLGVPPNAEFEKRLAEAARQVPTRGGFPGVSQWPAFVRRGWVITAAVAIVVLAITVISSHRPAAPINMPVDMARTDRGAVGDGISRIERFWTRTKPSVAERKATSELAENLSQSVDGQPFAADSNRLVSSAEFGRAEGQQTPMIARTVTLSIMVKDFSFSRTAVDAILARHHGYAASLNASTQQNTARSVQASLRIPAGELVSAVAELKSLGQVQNESQNGEEVTQQHADLVARLKNSRETEQRLQAILLQRTGKISDVLAVEQEIARVRGEIEQMEAEQKSLEHRVDFAAIDLNLAEEYKAQIGSPSPSISRRLHNALVDGYRSAIEGVVSLILFFAEYGPSGLIWLVVLAPLAWFLHRRWAHATSVVS
jgi:anti-sigma factor RsiW